MVCDRRSSGDGRIGGGADECDGDVRVVFGDEMCKF